MRRKRVIRFTRTPTQPRKRATLCHTRQKTGLRRDLRRGVRACRKDADARGVACESCCAVAEGGVRQ